MKIINLFLSINMLLAPNMVVLAQENSNNQCEIIYKNFSKDNSNVYYQGHKLYSADPKTFKVIGESQYSVDNHSVYYEVFRIAGADPFTFELLDQNDKRYAKDANRVYLEGRVIEGANPKYFKHVQDYFYKDDRYVFHAGELLENADSESFVLYDSNFGRDISNLYQISYTTHGLKLLRRINLENQGIDNPSDLIYLESKYFKYLDEYYYFDYDSLLHLKMPNRLIEYIGENYFHDDTAVYQHKTKRESDNNEDIFTKIDADIDTFQRVTIDNVSVFKDKKSCYQRDERIDCNTLIEYISDIPSFNRQDSYRQYLTNCDNKFLSHQTELYFLSDAEISLDDQHVYYSGKAIKGADPLTFEYVGAINYYRVENAFFRDKNNVYLNGKVVKGIDAKTFVLLSDLRARDRYQILLRSTLEKLIND